MFRHFFYLKKKGGAGGSRIAGGVYLNLWDGMKSHYLLMPLSSSLTNGYHKWFYIQQEARSEVACDILRVPETQDTWSVRPSAEEMVEVQELLQLFNKQRLDGLMMVANWVYKRVQPCKERVHPMYEYESVGDATRESPDALGVDECNLRLVKLFVMDGYRMPPVNRV